MRISDILAEHIMKILETEEDVVFRRNELAERFGCVPSQINYVLTSRFTPEQGYIVESRRGGGGYVRISRIITDKGDALMHIINSIGQELDNLTAHIMIRNLVSSSIITEDAGSLMMAAVSERSLCSVPVALRDKVRADIFKSMFLNLAYRR